MALINISIAQDIWPAHPVYTTEQMVDDTHETEPADIDGDGDDDILCALDMGKKIIWIENYSNGSFSAPMTIDDLDAGAREVLPADLDNDGDLDVISSSRDSIVAWYENFGNGQFGPRRIIATGLDNSFNVEAADLNNDSRLDILLTSYFEDKVIWYRNSGGGNFGTERVISSDLDTPAHAHAVDLDNDGDLDVAVASYWENELALYENLGGGNFSPATSMGDGAVFATFIRSEDFDADGLTDLMVCSFAGRFYFFRNLGNGNYQQEDLYLSSSNLWEFGADDLDGDGDLDLYADTDLKHFTWFENDGDAGFDISHDIEIFNLSGNRRSFARDMDGDNDPDLVSAHSSDDIISWHTNDGNGNFGSMQCIATILGGSFAIEAGDVYGAGEKDVIAASSSKNLIAAFENRGNGEFDPLDCISMNVYYTTAMDAGDMDNDGDADIVAISNAFNSLDRLFWFENDGNGRYSMLQTIDEDSSLISSIISTVRLHDLNGDGLSDILISSYGTGDLFWYANQGGSNFSARRIIAEDIDGLSTVVATDLDGDNDPDIAWAQRWDETISWAANDGMGNFVHMLDVPIASADGIRDLASADMDSDGDMDLIWTDNTSISWFANDGAGNFGTPVTVFDHGDILHLVVPADIDGDGDTDILTGLPNIGWFTNDGSGSFGPMRTISQMQANDMVPVDMNDDGKLDVLAIGPEIIWYENLIDEELTRVVGRVFWDKDGDNLFNNDDEPLSQYPLELQPEGSIFYTDEQGEYTVATAIPGTHEISTALPSAIGCLGPVEFDLTDPDILPFQFDHDPLEEIQQNFVFAAPVVDCRVLSGKVFYDTNENGVQDGTESGHPGIRVKTLSSGSTVSNSQGDYSIWILGGMEEEVSIELPTNVTNGYCNLFSATSTQSFPPGNAAHSISADTGDLSDLDFGMFTEEDTTFDVGIYSLMVLNGNEAGEDFHAYMDFKAYGLIEDACTIRITHSPLVTLLNSSLPPMNQGITWVEWVFPPGTAPAWYCMEMNWHLDSSAVQGETLHWEATYDCPPGTDACPANNDFIRDVDIISGPLRIIQGPVRLYSMRPAGAMPEVVSDQEVLSFVITFNNPLPHTAHDVLVIDRLPEELDLTTISAPFSSHPDHRFRVSDDGTLAWEFDGIDLMSASEDVVNSYGFVQFNVSLKENLPAGSVITNSAIAAFNGNPAIVSNEVIHRLEGGPTNTPGSMEDFEAVLYPNPFNRIAIFQIRTPRASKFNLVMMDITGRQVRGYSGFGSEGIVIEKQNLSSGLYFLNVYEHDSDNLLGSFKLVVAD